MNINVNALKIVGNDKYPIMAPRSWLHEVCHDVAVEPPLQPLTGQALVPASANLKDDGRADIRARGFWGR